jgi:hypothetical protein
VTVSTLGLGTWPMGGEWWGGADDDEGALAMPLELAEYIAAHGPDKEQLEIWIRGKVAAGGSIHDYYPPTPEKAAEYTAETGRDAPATDPSAQYPRPVRHG